MKKRILIVQMLLLVSIVSSAKAALHDRGNGLIYDDELNITWMGNANYGGGTMTWDNAVSWAESLIFESYDDWRLPLSDTACSGNNCIGSEMGHLFDIDGVTADNPGLFTDVKSYMYWSGTEDSLDSSNAWRFNFKYGTQDINAKTSARYAWAVRDGDSAPPVAPEPVSSLLFLTGGATVMARRFREYRKKHSCSSSPQQGDIVRTV